jgi:hypothetical protein
MFHLAGSGFHRRAHNARLDQRRWHALRLNLAHYGGVWNLAPDDVAKVIAPAGGQWPAEPVGMVGTPPYPNLHADLADYDIGRPDGTKRRMLSCPQ